MPPLTPLDLGYIIYLIDDNDDTRFMLNLSMSIYMRMMWNVTLYIINQW